MKTAIQEQYADDEPAPPPDTVMLTDQQPAAAAPAPALPVQHQPHQAQQPALPASAPQAGIQSNVFAAALAQAMGVLSQQQGVVAASLQTFGVKLAARIALRASDRYSHN